MADSTKRNTSQVLAGFGVRSLCSALLQDRPVREDIQANIAYFRQADLECCWIVLDFMDFDRQAIDHIKGVVSKSCIIPLEHVHVLTTHNHGAGEADNLNIGIVALKSVEAVDEGKASAAPAFLRYAQTVIEEQLNYVRRFHVEEFSGSSTLFFGSCAADGFDCSEYLKHQIHILRERGEISYCGKSLEASNSISLNPMNRTGLPPGDKTVSILRFERADGLAIGNICRFAAHAVCCNRPEYYSSDYPFYTRKYLSENLGGPTIFMNGPCGEIAPAIPDKTSAEERRVGLAIGKAALRALDGIHSLPITDLEDRLREIVLPVRDDLPDSKQAAREIESLLEKLAIPQNLPLPEVRKIAERIVFLRTVPFLRKKWLNGESQDVESRKTVTARLGWLSFNGTGILAFPGETFNSTAERVKIQSGLANLITVTEHDRTIMYVPPEKEHSLGGYETTCCMTSPEAESILYDGALSMFNQN
jgi:hypothetical protein